jgi:hypothetical protein
MFENCSLFWAYAFKICKKYKLKLCNVQAMENIMSSSCVIFRPKVSTDADWTSIFATGATGCFAKTRQAKEYLFEFIFTKKSTVQYFIFFYSEQVLRSWVWSPWSWTYEARVPLHCKNFNLGFVILLTEKQTLNYFCDVDSFLLNITFEKQHFFYL